MRRGNKDLNAARWAKKDEFYTRLADIELELKHYKRHFAGKTVLCNCDDPFESSFFKYFAMNFNWLGLKRLVSTSWAGPSGKVAWKAVVDVVHDADGNGILDLDDIRSLFETGENWLESLEGSGDFASPECLRLLDEADIVVTNPPFSLFRTYLPMLVEHGKKFLVIGSLNAVTCRDVFPLFMEGRVWLGANAGGGAMPFYVPDGYPLAGASCGIDEATKRRYVVVHGVRWFTNLDVERRHEKLPLECGYSPSRYPKYDNYDAIEVGQVKDIPCDYDGAMGVPVTFLDKFDPEQFEILGCTESEGKGFSNGLWDRESGIVQPLLGGFRVYKRLFVRKRCRRTPSGCVD